MPAELSSDFFDTAVIFRKRYQGVDSQRTGVSGSLVATNASV